MRFFDIRLVLAAAAVVVALAPHHADAMTNAADALVRRYGHPV